ncbi:phenylalanine--tRNA ligase subunit alpha [Ureaplasma miroungigenitalium]|uniref:Phenylalanine--tRNA ligase alpha subunit n=1 Tax=Ureaplasma miroungigenitalium TaxID=1042321 RepID=A0ABT3BM34_9BACT|nr:phenylalanine--tRNA ligase subunit alpha [Ureaplasma miroungigenitalium]MCV3728296.1 phenylalanine--tRNA ligase subunit alpha [Ureaplasma miroungigenitalium]
MVQQEKLLLELKTKLSQAQNKQQLVEIKNIFVKQNLTPLYGELKNATDKKSMGLLLNELKLSIEQAFNDACVIFDEQDEPKDFGLTNNLHLPANDLSHGHLHLFTQTINDVISFFKQLNFDIITGDEVVLQTKNFDALNINENHPARMNADSFFINHSYMLRTHCTTNTAYLLENNPSHDIRIMSYGNVYRKDDDDATHSHQFMQIDFVWVKEELNIANLKWLITEFLSFIFQKQLKTRFRLSFFPFTEPSFEVDVECFKCNGAGCHVCKQSTWIEIMGAGMLHQNVLQAANLPTHLSGLAFGIGIDRIIMLKHNIDDIRHLYANNLKFNKQF